MKNFLMLIAALFIVWLVWGLVTFFVHVIVGFVFKVAMILLFCYAVYAVYRVLTRDKARL